MHQPSEPAFEPAQWAKLNFAERLKVSTRDYILRGCAIPLPAYVFHAVKLALFIAGWFAICVYTPTVGSLAEFRQWVFKPIVFQKAVLWAGLWEALGLASMSGPLGLRVWPPFTALLQFARPGTIKLAPFPRLPIIGGFTRTWLDVAAYVGYIVAIVYALVQPELRPLDFLPLVILLPICALGDRTVPLAARWEHHFAMCICFLLAGDWIAACKWVQLAIWFWAGVSKLTVAFPYVVAIMAANNPSMRSHLLRRGLFRAAPDDLAPSIVPKVMAIAGTFLEFATPLTLLFVTHSGPLQWLGLAFMLALHGFILSNMPIAAVFEWNVFSVFAGLFLFLGHPEVSLFDVGSTPLTLYLVVALLILPLLGNFWPAKVSFLISMRYYAGNWAWAAYLFRGRSFEKLDRLKRAAPLLLEQLERFFAPARAVQIHESFNAFRSMHLQGRVLGLLLPRALEGRPSQDYTWVDGELVAGSVLGWNFGEGHLYDERLIAAIQSQCHFEPGELRAVCVEAQPLFGSTLHWRIVDANQGQLAEGYAELAELARRAPWDCG
ncbi:MAG: DUF3556 domain-containing protein [Pirellulales bacterium]